jgi:hypothetical protein
MSEKLRVAINELLLILGRFGDLLDADDKRNMDKARAALAKAGEVELNHKKEIEQYQNTILMLHSFLREEGYDPDLLYLTMEDEDTGGDPW